MEFLDTTLQLLATHWEVLASLGALFVSGGYIIARYRTSGMRKMLNAHSEILDDLSNRLNRLRIELENARDELSEEKNKLYSSQERVRELESRVKELENAVKDVEKRELELLQKMNQA